MNQIPITDVVWDPSIYPRAKWTTSVIDAYVEALEAGDEFPPIVVEADTMRLLDGKHRLEAHRRAGRDTIAIDVRAVPEGMTAKHYAATWSARHGERMSNADLRALAREEFEANPTAMSPAEWGRHFGLAERTVRRWVADIVERERRGRETAAWRLSRLGWTQRDIARILGIDFTSVSKMLKSGHLADFQQALPQEWNDRLVADEAARLGIGVADALAAAMGDLDDLERLDRLGISLQPYDVWHFAGCHDLMGDAHPGRIPGELVCHALTYLTDPGDLVVDPMAGSGTTLDACLLMGRRARGYDIDQRHNRVDVETHDLTDGWPATVAKASLIFWDPPYFDKMDAATIGAGGYIDGSISGLDPDSYLDWFTKRFDELHAAVKPGTRLAFLMSDWDPENAKRHADHRGLWEWDYVERLQATGWALRRQVQCPLSTQQVHPDIVNKFRASKRMARLGRYLLVAEA